ncbi:MAG: 1-acyl-sn-glycerol-3-phosphate acyltransferase [Acidimicrobiia bacterium]
MSRQQTIRRRLRSITLVVVGFVGVSLLFPVLILGSFLFDVVRLAIGHRRFMALRLVVVGWVYLAAETVGIAALGLVWIASVGGRQESVLLGGSYAIQRRWAGTLFAVVRVLFALRFEVEGAEVLTPGPIHVFMRHASIIDNLLPSVLISAPHGFRLRYVLKRELLFDPALDIAGSRLPNHFVDRSTGGPAEATAIGALGSGLGADEGTLIYPEGTRFTEERRQRALARLENDQAALARAGEFENVLPPRISGPLALLDVDPAADVVIAAHKGLDGFSHVRDILGGGLIGSVVSVRFQRFSAAGIPDSPELRREWLYDRWGEVDRWIAGA